MDNVNTQAVYVYTLTDTLVVEELVSSEAVALVAALGVGTAVFAAWVGKTLVDVWGTTHTMLTVRHS